MGRIKGSVYRDTSSKGICCGGKEARHNCFRAEVSGWEKGWRIWRKRRRFKSEQEAREWLAAGAPG
ncbi:hypothetical protein [Neisseria perflava]|uniref:hypothetical protein n=1 Tax=Neisseria perflava TaxID=33053 RepID=UPI00209C79D4|nr:hypothetical protein [Neisseria perflava]MCP1659303.1 hypothetical protein [Neisseria perflava]MCP1772894.1 hypothetical protein [Neisseria perflava]